MNPVIGIFFFVLVDNLLAKSVFLKIFLEVLVIAYQNGNGVLNPAFDPIDRYFLHPNENPGNDIVPTNTVLTGSNYFAISKYNMSNTKWQMMKYLLLNKHNLIQLVPHAKAVSPVVDLTLHKLKCQNPLQIADNNIYCHKEHKVTWLN